MVRSLFCAKSGRPTSPKNKVSPEKMAWGGLARHATIRGAFHRVSWGVEHFNFHGAHLEAFPVCSDVRLEPRVGVGAKHNGGASFLSQGHVTGHEVRMEVRFKHVFDAGAAALGQVEVGLHFRRGSMMAISPWLSMQYAPWARQPV